MDRRATDPTILAACGLTAISCLVAYGGLLSDAYPGDTSVYEGYGRALLDHGRIPYRDFYDEYPPGSVPLFVLPALIWASHYLIVFKLLMTACAVGATWVTASLLLRLRLSPARILPVIVAPVLLGPVFLNRYDPVPALLVVCALSAFLAGRGRVTGALLGVATALKIFPAVLLPLLVRSRETRGRIVGWFIGSAALLVLPFFALAPGGVGYSLKTQLTRHLQIESLGASVLLVGSKLGIHHVGWIAGKPGSIDLGGAAADTVGLLSSTAAVALVLLIARRYWLGPATETRLVTAFAAAVVAFTVFGKVLSPQYLVWLVPLIPLVAGRKGIYASGTFTAALALSMPEYLFWGRYGLREQDWTVYLLLLRNGLLVATFVFLWNALAGGRGQAARVATTTS